MAEIQLQRRSRDTPASLAHPGPEPRTRPAHGGGKAFSRSLHPCHETSLKTSLAPRADALRLWLPTNMPEDNDDNPENHISDRQESFEVKATAPILARLHFLTINVFGSCQNWEQSGAAGCRIRKGDPNLELFSDRVILGLKKEEQLQEKMGHNCSLRLLLIVFSGAVRSEAIHLQNKREFLEIV